MLEFIGGLVTGTVIFKSSCWMMFSNVLLLTVLSLTGCFFAANYYWEGIGSAIDIELFLSSKLMLAMSSFDRFLKGKFLQLLGHSNGVCF
jgi:hypothetical protein